MERNPGFFFYYYYCRNVASILHDNGHRWNFALSTFHHFRLFITFNLGNTLGAFGLPFPRFFSVQNLQTCSCYLNHSLSLFSLICSIAYCRQCPSLRSLSASFFELILATTHSFPTSWGEAVHRVQFSRHGNSLVILASQAPAVWHRC